MPSTTPFTDLLNTFYPNGAFRQGVTEEHLFDAVQRLQVLGVDTERRTVTFGSIPKSQFSSGFEKWEEKAVS